MFSNVVLQHHGAGAGIIELAEIEIALRTR